MTTTRMAWRVCWVMALAALGWVSPGQAASETRPVEQVVTDLALHPGALATLGWEIANIRDNQVLAHHALSVSAGQGLAFASHGPFGLSAEVENSRFKNFFSGSLRHRGGFDLRYPGGSLSLHGFVVQAGAGPRSFEVRTAEGLRVFVADYAHYALDARRGLLQIFNMDLRIAEELAQRLGRPALEGMAVGVLALEAVVVAGGNLSAPQPVAGVPGCGDWSGEVDVALTAMSSVGQTERQGGLVSLTPSAALKNVGTANVPWYAKFSAPAPPYGNDQHPFLVWQMYRLRNDVFEQMGFSDVKHAFLTVNDNCEPGACTDNHILGIGCEDVYSQGTNVSYSSLSFRSEVTAGKGLWQSTGSHFDQNNDGNQDHPGPTTPDDTFPTHRLVIPEATLDLPGERYFFETWYIVRDDVNPFNNMGWREINPNFAGSNWSFSMVTPFAQGSALDAWVPSANPGPNAAHQVLTVLDGHLRLAMKVSTVGEGLYRYEYALMNHDFDPQVGTFSVPFGAAVPTISELYFHDLDQEVGNDWTVEVNSGGVHWTRPAAAPGLDYGRMYNFGFTATAAALAGNAAMTAVEPTATPNLSIATLAPLGAVNRLFTDGFESGDAEAWSSATP